MEKREKAYSIIHLQIYGFNYYYKDYSGRSAEEIVNDWKRTETVRGFAGDNSERIDAGTFAWMEQMITETDRYPDWVGLYDEDLQFSAHVDVDHNQFQFFSREKYIEIPLLANGSLIDSSNVLQYAGDVPIESHERAITDQVRLFIDMDGVLARFQAVDTLEILYEKGYFLNLPPQTAVVEAAKQLVMDPRVEVFILSSVLSDSQYALEEKNAWLDAYLPEVNQSHRIFPPCGKDKKQYVPDGIRETDCLLDDYTRNLSNWEPPAKGIKLLNGINHTKGTWKGAMVSQEMTGDQLYRELIACVLPMPTEERKGRSI